MRVISTANLKAGQRLGQTLYTEAGQILLNKGVVLTSFTINRLIEAGYNSVYAWEDGVEYVLEDVIRPEVRQKTIADLRKFTNSITKSTIKNTKTEDSIDILRANASTIVDELFNKKDIVIELIDIKNINNYLYQHSVNVMIHSVILGISIGLNKTELSKLALAALLHDIGLVFIPHEILHKKSSLKSDEYELIKEHSKKGYEFLRDYFNLDSIIRVGVLDHHEHFDGSGYPNQKKGEDIHLFARIINIANKYDTLTSDSSYRQRAPVAEAIEYIMGGGGTIFDPNLTKMYISHINPYPVHTLVRLHDERVGAVIKVNGSFYTRPIVRIIHGEGKNTEINLMKEKNIIIKTIL